MLRIIKRSELIERLEYSRVFEWRDMAGAGFSFESDKDGNVNVAALNELARANYESCISGAFNVTDKGVRIYRHSYREPAIAECICNHHITLASFTNTCEKCGRDYNSSGQLLASRDQWGEETGETASDILNIGHTIS